MFLEPSKQYVIKFPYTTTLIFFFSVTKCFGLLIIRPTYKTFKIRQKYSENVIQTMGYNMCYSKKVKQSQTGPEGSQISWQRHRMVVGCQPYAPAAFTPRKYSWYSFLLDWVDPRAILRSERFYVNMCYSSYYNLKLYATRYGIP